MDTESATELERLVTACAGAGIDDEKPERILVGRAARPRRKGNVALDVSERLRVELPPARIQSVKSVGEDRYEVRARNIDRLLQRGGRQRSLDSGSRPTVEPPPDDDQTAGCRTRTEYGPVEVTVTPVMHVGRVTLMRIEVWQWQCKVKECPDGTGTRSCSWEFVFGYMFFDPDDVTELIPEGAVPDRQP